MKKIFTLISFSFLLNFYSWSQSTRRPVSANYIGASAYSKTQIDVFSFTTNQAALAKIKNVSAGIYGERKYMLNELSFYNAVFTLPTRSGNFGFKGGYYGFNSYNETQAGLAYGRSLGSKIDIGVQFNYYNIKIAGYGTASAISAEAGIIMHLTTKLNAGIHFSNPAGGKFGKNVDEKIPFVYSAALGYEGSQNFFVSMEIEKEENKPVNVNSSLQYRFVKQLFARAGISSGNGIYWFGAGVLVKTFRIDVIASYHAQLGLTPGLLFTFDLSKPKEENK